ncbi:hypothetical protein ABKV19_009060 [Rosa sericea]
MNRDNKEIEANEKHRYQLQLEEAISNIVAFSLPVFGGGYVVVQDKLPNYVVPDLTDFKLKPYVSQCPKTAESAESTK